MKKHNYGVSFYSKKGDDVICVRFMATSHYQAEKMVSQIELDGYYKWFVYYLNDDQLDNYPTTLDELRLLPGFREI